MAFVWRPLPHYSFCTPKNFLLKYVFSYFLLYMILSKSNKNIMLQHILFLTKSSAYRNKNACIEKCESVFIIQAIG